MNKKKPLTMTEAAMQLENENRPTFGEKFDALERQLASTKKRIDRIEQAVFGHVIID